MPTSVVTCPGNCSESVLYGEGPSNGRLDQKAHSHRWPIAVLHQTHADFPLNDTRKELLHGCGVLSPQRDTAAQPHVDAIFQAHVVFGVAGTVMHCRTLTDQLDCKHGADGIPSADGLADVGPAQWTVTYVRTWIVRTTFRENKQIDSCNKQPAHVLALFHWNCNSLMLILVAVGMCRAHAHRRPQYVNKSQTYVSVAATIAIK